MARKPKSEAGNSGTSNYPHLENNPRAVRYLSSEVVKWQRDRIAAAGGDPRDVPDISPARFLALREVIAMVGISSATIHRMRSTGQFPKPIAVDRAAVRGAAATA